MAKSKPYGLASLKSKRYVTGGEINAIYQDLFGRPADSGGMDYWASQLSGKTAAEAYQAIGNAATGQDKKEVTQAEINDKAVTAAYREQLGREPDTAGLKNYVSELQSGKTINDINQALNRSLEGQQFDTQVLTSGYRQMFERNPEQEGFQYWLSRMQSDPALAQKEINTYLKGGAQNADIAKAAKAMAEGFYTNITSPDLEADPYGGRAPTRSIYDVPANAANVSSINGVPVQFVAPVTQGTVRSQFTTGAPTAPGYTATAGESILQSGAVAAAAKRALDSGAMSSTEFRTLQSDLTAAGNDTNKIFAALNKPQGKIVLDQVYGIQLGAGNTLEEAQNRAAAVQGVLKSLNTPYAPSNFLLAEQAKAMGVPYAFGKEAFTGYNTQATTADILNQTNARLKALESVNALEGTLVARDRPTYAPVTFAKSAVPAGATAPPPLEAFKTYATKDLLAEAAPGYASAVFGKSGMPAPAVFSGVPTPGPGVPVITARPAINVSPEYQGARDVVAAIEAARGLGSEGKARGGVASLAEQVQSKGRGNDTMLVHMTPNEVAGLQALAMQMGGSGTVNPQTGLPEFGWLDKTFKRFVKPFARVAQFVLPFVPGIGLPTAALLSGIAGGFASKGNKTFDFKKALVSGITSYGLGSLARSAAAAGEAAAVSGVNAGRGLATNIEPGVLETMSASDVAANIASQPITAAPGVAPAGTAPLRFTENIGPNASPMDYAKATGQNIQASLTGAPSLLSRNIGVQQAAQAAGAPNILGGGPMSPTTAASITYGGTTLGVGMDEAEKQKAQQLAATRAKEEEDERMRQRAYAIMAANPLQFSFAEGGSVDDNPVVDMATGGLKEGSFIVPADVVAHLGNGSSEAGLKMLAKKYGATPIKGPGDGMSDSIPTSIEGKQRARIADGEAIISPAMTAKVGPKQLYSMMDKVRKARTGTTKQGKQINPMRYMPA